MTAKFCECSPSCAEQHHAPTGWCNVEHCDCTHFRETAPTPPSSAIAGVPMSEPAFWMCMKCGASGRALDSDAANVAHRESSPACGYMVGLSTAKITFIEDMLGSEVTRLRAALAEAEKDAAQQRAAKDGAYEERNRVVAALARTVIAHGGVAGIKRTAIEGWSEDWHGCVYIDLPCGQASWHFHDSQRDLFAGLPPYAGTWDGHTTPEKYARLDSLRRSAPGERT